VFTYAGRTILLVEDEAIIAMSEKLTLEQDGLRVKTASNGEKAVQSVRDDPSIDLVLMDIDLGSGINGTVAAQRILGIRPVPIVFLTSHNEQEMVSKVKGITRYGYVLKNAGKFVLRESISMAFELHEAMQKVQRHAQRIEESERKFRLLAENSVDCIWTMDKRLRFTYLSPSLKKIAGFTPDQWEGTHLRTHFRAKEFLRVGAIAANALRHYKTFTDITFETKMLNNRNEEIDLEITGRLLKNAAGKVIGLQGTTRDISFRKTEEKRTRKRHYRFRTSRRGHSRF